MIGLGGTGKSTSLLTLWKNSVCGYSLSRPVVLYIPLYSFDGRADFIQRRLLSQLKFDEKTTSIADAQKKLCELLNIKRENSAPDYLLLLDGWNEASGDTSPLRREITELAVLNGVQIILTSRTDTFKLFSSKVELLPLERGQINAFLLEKNAPVPNDEATMKLLANPMLLSIYCKTNELGGAETWNAQTSEELLAVYMRVLLTAHDRSEAAEHDEQADYALNVLLPLISGYLNKSKKYFLTTEELYGLASRSFSMLKSRAFIKAYPQYTGKTKEIAGEVQNAEEWFGNIINVLLVKKFALLASDTQGRYRFSHQFFQEGLAEMSKKNRSAEARAKTRVYFPVLCCSLAAVVLLAIGAAKLISSIPGQAPLPTPTPTAEPYPAAGEETVELKNAATYAVLCLGKIELLFVERQAIQEYMDDELCGGAMSAYNSLVARIEQGQKNINGITVEHNGVEDALEALAGSRAPFSLTTLKSLYDMPAECKSETLMLMELWEAYYSPENIRPSEDKRKVSEICEELTANEAAIAYISARDMALCAPPDIKSMFTEAFSTAYVIGNAMLTQRTDESTQTLLTALNQQRRNILRDLNELGFQIPIYE